MKMKELQRELNGFIVQVGERYDREGGTTR